jgi:hypothetical protein
MKGKTRMKNRGEEEWNLRDFHRNKKEKGRARRAEKNSMGLEKSRSSLVCCFYLFQLKGSRNVFHDTTGSIFRPVSLSVCPPFPITHPTLCLWLSFCPVIHFFRYLTLLSSRSSEPPHHALIFWDPSFDSRVSASVLPSWIRACVHFPRVSRSHRPPSPTISRMSHYRRREARTYGYFDPNQES